MSLHVIQSGRLFLVASSFFFSQLSRIDVRSDLSFHYNPFFIILIYIIAITLPVLFRRTFSWGHQRKLVFLKHYFVVKISVVIPGVT